MVTEPALRAGPGGSLSDVADGVACRTGAWVVVEHLGAVVAHGAGSGPCPPPLAAALLSKCMEPLRPEVTWTGGGRRLRGTLTDAAVTAIELGVGTTAWFVGGEADDDMLVLLGSALDDRGPVADSLVESLIHPRGPVRTAVAPRAWLLVLISSAPLHTLARAAVVAATGADARVHADGECVVVAAASRESVATIAAAARGRCADAHAGAAEVAADASDWVGAARQAQAAAHAAKRLGLSLAFATSPAVAAELIVSEAHESACALARELRRTPLTLVQEYDARCSGGLVATLRAWCSTGFDVAAAAAAVHVHPNTLRYRLRRAGEISGLDLHDTRHLLALQLLLAA